MLFCCRRFFLFFLVVFCFVFVVVVVFALFFFLFFIRKCPVDFILKLENGCCKFVAVLLFICFYVH